MNTVETVLIVLLSIGFIVLLALSIILVGVMIAIVKRLNVISKRAQEATDSVADIAAMVGKRVAPVAISTAIAAAMRRLKKK